MTRLSYVANIRLPTEKAHGIQIMETCNAFSDAGVHVELIVPRRRTHILADPFLYYDISHSFSVRKLWCLDTVRFGKVGYLLELASFTCAVIFFALHTKTDLYYTRDESIALILALVGKKVAWEDHRGSVNLAVRLLLRTSVPIVVISEALRSLYISRGEKPERILTAPDAADTARFAIPVSQIEARKKLGLPEQVKIVLYKGHLYEWKGAHTLARAAALLPEDMLCIFIGGTETDVALFTKEFGNQANIRILGNRPRNETPLYQKAADILVLPNSAKEDISKLYTSPLKLFGYMASGVPLVASDLPSIREVLDPTIATFSTPDDPQKLKDAILSVFADYPQAIAKAHKAAELAKTYSWKNRARTILKFLG